MPNIDPANVATSPKATRRDSWICPCGSMIMPVKSNASPPMDRIAAVMSCMIRSFIFLVITGRKNVPEMHDVFEIRCKSSTKKRSHQKMGLRLVKKRTFRKVRCIFAGLKRPFERSILFSRKRCKTDGYVHVGCLFVSIHDTRPQNYDSGLVWIRSRIAFATPVGSRLNTQYFRLS